MNNMSTSYKNPSYLLNLVINMICYNSHNIYMYLIQMIEIDQKYILDTRVFISVYIHFILTCI